MTSAIVSEVTQTRIETGTSRERYPTLRLVPTDIETMPNQVPLERARPTKGWGTVVIFTNVGAPSAGEQALAYPADELAIREERAIIRELDGLLDDTFEEADTLTVQQGS